MSTGESFPGIAPDDTPKPEGEEGGRQQRKRYVLARERLERVKAERERRSLTRFIRGAWPIIEPKTEYLGNWHIDAIARQLEALSRGEIPLAPDGKPADGIVINVPAGTSKTRLVSVGWPCWDWTTNPSRRFLIATYALDRSIDSNNDARKVVESDWYRERWPHVELSGDQNVKKRFDTTRRGWRIGVAVGGEGTGLHPDFIIIDDALSADDARSEVKRKAAKDWFEQTVSTRGMTRQAFVVHIAQRLHEDDLAGVLLRSGRYAHIRFPMYYEEAKPEGQRPKNYMPPDPLDPRTKEGELLWPELISAEKAEAVGRMLGPSGRAGQFQQRPAPLEGLSFKREWFKIIGALPGVKADGEVRFWDVAATEGGAGARTAGTRMLMFGAIAVIVDVRCDRLSPAGVDDLILQTAQMDGPDVAVREEQEPGSSGKAVVAARRKLLKGFDYDGITSTGDKELRANPLRAAAEGGNVRILVRAGHSAPPWVEEYLSEVVVFPNGSLKDQVDSSASAYNFLNSPNTKRKFEVLW